MSLLRLENITKRFGGLVAVDNVTLEVKEGELIAIVGPNGAGKTTLFNVVSGAFLPDEGKVFFEDRDITQLGQRYHSTTCVQESATGLGANLPDSQAF